MLITYPNSTTGKKWPKKAQKGQKKVAAHNNNYVNQPT